MSGSRFLLSGVGYADDDGFDFLHAREVGGGGQASGLDLLLHHRRFDVLDVALALVDGLDLGRVDVQAQHVHTRAGELQRERQPHVTQTHDRDIHVRNSHVLFKSAKVGDALIQAREACSKEC